MLKKAIIYDINGNIVALIEQDDLDVKNYKNIIDITHFDKNQKELIFKHPNVFIMQNGNIKQTGKIIENDNLPKEKLKTN